MKRKVQNSLAALLVVFMFSACSVNEHMVGKGAQNGQSVSQKQWYVLASGLARINNVDTNAMADGAENYTIKTRSSFVDYLIGGISFGLIGARTVTVTK